MSSAGRRQLVRVLVDKDGGVTLDEIADATRLVGSLLDERNVLADAPYTLEVTSPGTDRPLTLPRHWRRNIDRLVKVQCRADDELTGRILDAGEASATLHVEGEQREVFYADVEKARVEIEFSRPDHAAAAKKRAAKSSRRSQREHGRADAAVGSDSEQGAATATPHDSLLVEE
ncbi:MAG: ribosome maturation factor RimP [Nocardioidaceae bacterium]